MDQEEKHGGDFGKRDGSRLITHILDGSFRRSIHAIFVLTLSIGVRIPVLLATLGTFSLGERRALCGGIQRGRVLKYVGYELVIGLDETVIAAGFATLRYGVAFGGDQEISFGVVAFRTENESATEKRIC